MSQLHLERLLCRGLAVLAQPPFKLCKPNVVLNSGLLHANGVLLDRYMNPWDLQSARRIRHVGIFRTLSDVERNPLYDKEAIEQLKIFFATKAGLIQAGQNSLIAADKAKRLLDLGVPDVMMPILGETYVELNELQVKVWGTKRIRKM